MVSVYDFKIHPTANYLVAGTHGRSMYKIDLAQVVGISSNTAEVPGGFELYQNYPNPFNPSTKISYNLQAAGNISLKVHDITGRQVAELVNSRQNAGEHEVGFFAGNLSSGVYFYSLSVNGVVMDVKKMTVVK
jgi:hypothetical protein